MSLSLILCGTTLCGPGGELPPAPGAPRPAVHAVAFVNDSLSHGLVGDGLLSFNEAIRLHNGTLTAAQLSPAEQAQVQLIPGTGPQTFLAWANFDGSSTPVVTVQQDLDPILDTTFGFYINSVNEPTVLDFSTSTGTHGLRVPANSFEMKDMILVGGQYGMDVTQTDVSGQAGVILNHVGFENQVQFGLRVRTTTPNAVGRAYLDGCTFVNAASAIVFDENVAGRTTIFELHACRIRGAQAGVDVVLGAGGTGRYTFDRVVIEAANTGLRLMRPTGGNRTALLESQHVDVRAGTVGVAIGCAPTGVTWATMRMWNVRSTNNATALVLGSLGDSVYGELEELTLEGAVSVLAGGGPLPLSINNVRCKNGNVAFGSSPAQTLAVTASRFDTCAVQTQGSAAVAFAACCFAGGTLAGTAAAPAQCTNSFVQGAGSHVTQTGSLPAQQLGSMKLLPDTITVGSTATFQAELPNGLFGVFVLGFTDLAPALQPQPLHLYSIPAYTFTLPGIYRFQQSYAWPIPNVQLFVGMNLTVQMVALPDPGVAAPPFQLPPGRHFSLQ